VTEEADELISIREAAKTLGVHPSTLRNWDRAGRLKAVRVGSRRDRRFKKSEVLAQAGDQGRRDWLTVKDLMQAGRLASQSSPIAEIAKALGTTPAGLNEMVARCQAAVDALGPLAAVAERLRESFAHTMDVMSPMRAVDSLFKESFAQLYPDLSESVTRFGDVLEPILWEQKLFGDHMRDYLSSVSEAFSSKLYEQFAATQAELFSTQAIAGLAGSFEIAGIAEAASLLSQQITANIGAYQDFSRVALWDLEARGGPSDRRLPFAELKLAGGLLESATSLASDLRARVSETPTTTARKPNFFRHFHQQAHEVRAPQLLSDLELERHLKALKAFRAGNDGLAIVEAWGQVNRAAQLGGQDPIFQPSVDAVTIAARLPLSFAEDEEELGELVDGLFKLIFEASGDGRRLEAVADPGEYETVKDIVVLRHYYRHDLAQGASSDDSKRRFRRVGDVFDRLVGRRNPSAAADWQGVCLALMRRAEGFLRAIADKLEGQE
jgi:excisionase family DNA binding protein